jgi:1,4-dihydroxy-2-naphthoate polyprenyltransferase
VNDRPTAIGAWLLAFRLRTLPAAAVPVVVGTACVAASGSVRWGAAIVALVGALLLQIGANLANDVFDAEKGADGPDRVGPTRAVASGLLTGGSVKTALVIVFLLATVCGAYLTWVAGPIVVAIGIASIAAAIAYTGGPYPLGYHGLGDLFVMIFFGFVAVAGTAFVQMGRVPAIAWAAALPVGALATAILVVNNLRDRNTDARAGKRTLAVRFGRGFAMAEYVALLGVAYLIPVLLRGWSLLPLVTLPLAALLVRRIAKEEGAALNARLAQTAQLLLVHGLLFAVGLAL